MAGYDEDLKGIACNKTSVFYGNIALNEATGTPLFPEVTESLLSEKWLKDGDVTSPTQRAAVLFNNSGHPSVIELGESKSALLSKYLKDAFLRPSETFPDKFYREVVERPLSVDREYFQKNKALDSELKSGKISKEQYKEALGDLAEEWRSDKEDVKDVISGLKLDLIDVYGQQKGDNPESVKALKDFQEKSLKSTGLTIDQVPQAINWLSRIEERLASIPQKKGLLDYLFKSASRSDVNLNLKWGGYNFVDLERALAGILPEKGGLSSVMKGMANVLKASAKDPLYIFKQNERFAKEGIYSTTFLEREADYNTKNFVDVFLHPFDSSINFQKNLLAHIGEELHNGDFSKVRKTVENQLFEYNIYNQPAFDHTVDSLPFGVGNALTGLGRFTLAETRWFYARLGGFLKSPQLILNKNLSKEESSRIKNDALSFFYFLALRSAIHGVDSIAPSELLSVLKKTMTKQEFSEFKNNYEKFISSANDVPFLNLLEKETGIKTAEYIKINANPLSAVLIRSEKEKSKIEATATNSISAVASALKGEEGIASLKVAQLGITLANYHLGSFLADLVSPKIGSAVRVFENSPLNSSQIEKFIRYSIKDLEKASGKEDWLTTLGKESYGNAKDAFFKAPSISGSKQPELTKNNPIQDQGAAY